MELWDAYNSEFEKQNGVVLLRGEAIPEGLYHLVSEVLVQHTDGDYLLMRRDEHRPFGGLWEATAGGSALRSESPLACALRELREETGIEAETLHELGTVRSRDTIYVEYLFRTDCAKDSVVLQEGETDAYRWVGRGELRRLDRKELVTQRVQGFVEELKDAGIPISNSE